MTDTIKFSTRLPRGEYELLAHAARLADRAVGVEAARRLRASLGVLAEPEPSGRETQGVKPSPARAEAFTSPGAVLSAATAPARLSASGASGSANTIPKLPGLTTAADLAGKSKPDPRKP